MVDARMFVSSPWKKGEVREVWEALERVNARHGKILRELAELGVRIVDIEQIRRLIRQGDYELSIHAQQERLEEDLDVVQIEEALLSGEILEQYPNDPRGESCRVVGYAGTKPVHVVIGWARRSAASRTLRTITVYMPKPPRWPDPQTRGERP